VRTITVLFMIAGLLAAGCGRDSPYHIIYDDLVPHCFAHDPCTGPGGCAGSVVCHPDGGGVDEACICVPADAGVDAGRDAPVAGDAPVADAAVHDAAVHDAPVPDAPVPDAAIHDAAIHDAASAEDAVAPDGGFAVSGEACGSSAQDLDAGARSCAPGLVCCYPCGMAGCVDQCRVPDPSWTDGCPAYP
jgi:hypothetical protein